MPSTDADRAAPRAPRVVRSREICAPAPRAWELVGNLHRHGELIPLTVMEAPDRPTRTGDVVVATSALVVVDRMVTTRVLERGEHDGARDWARWATLTKTGPVLVGEAHLVVRARGPERCVVVWAEDVELTLAGRALRPAVDLSLALMSDLALRRLAAALEA